ncbi:MAG: 16S rRNA (adenine(1518)-N(6)/adenine(1519)-N(6))-dimethyltransferase RsmA [Fibrobacterales bacterium]
MDRNRRRKFGQNFLNNDAIIQAIADDVELTRDDAVLEVGPGHGALTHKMLNKAGHVTAVEIDEKCVQYLNVKLKHRFLTVINKNFLDFDLAGYLEENPGATIVGNLPYNMATPILTSMLPHLSKSSGIMAMVQYEVAKRVCAEPGCRDYGFLTVLVNSYADARVLRKIGPENFTPRPNVMSATMMITHKENCRELTPEFMAFAKQCFAQKRKTLYNSLSSLYPKGLIKEGLEKVGLQEAIRAEAVGVDTFWALFDEIHPKNPK